MLPPFLNLEDEVRIISPSGVIDPKYIDGATEALASWGLKVTEGRFARSTYGRFAGTPEQRVADLQEAFDDPRVKAVLCSRGGYGLAQIIDRIDFSGMARSPKWLIGFSDITVLHSALTNVGVPSLHGIMARHLTEFSAKSHPVRNLKNVLLGRLPSYTVKEEEFNRYGVARGKVIGGNLSVLYGLRGTAFDLQFKDNILFIEDIAEKPYHIDRMMQNLRLSGVLGQISGLIVGQFSDCDEDPLMNKTITEIIFDAVKEYDYPVCFHFPAGHVELNQPLILGEDTYFEVNCYETIVKF